MARSKHRSHGIVLVETAIVLPIALMLMLAVAEFGRAFWQYNTLTKSIRDAARYAAGEGLFGSTGVIIITSDLTQDVQNLVVYGNTAGTGSPLLSGLTTSNITVESPGDGDILVRGNYPYAPLFGIIPNFGGGGTSVAVNFEAVVRMRAL